MGDEQAFTMLHDMVKEQGNQMRASFNEVHTRLDRLADTHATFNVELSLLRARVDRLHCIDPPPGCSPTRDQTAGQWLLSVGLDSVKYVIIAAVAAVVVLAAQPNKGQPTKTANPPASHP